MTNDEMTNVQSVSVRSGSTAADSRNPSVYCSSFVICHSSFRHSPRRGFVLIVVLIVIVLLALAAWTYTELMFAESQAAHFSGRQSRARALAESGVEMSLWLLGQTDDALQQLGGHYENDQHFFNKIVSEEPELGGFSIIAPRLTQDGRDVDGFRFGLQDESTKINLNAILVADQTPGGARQLLVDALGPIGMTDQLADAILDYIDPDVEPREFGAETYESIVVKNAPLESLEELLPIIQANEADWRLLFGRDINRNGHVDADEQELAGAFYDDQGGLAARGWSAFLTIYSAERNLNPEGEEKIDLNNNDLQDLHDQLSSAFGSREADFIVALRQNGPASGDNKDIPVTQSVTLDFDENGRVRFNNILEVIGADVIVDVDGQKMLLKTPFPFSDDSPTAAASYLTDLMDKAGVNIEPVIPGRINVNQAPRLILDGLPGFDEARRVQIVDAILSQRQGQESPLANPEFQYETWLLTKGVVKLDEMKAIMPLVCARGSVYRADVIGFFDEGGGAARVEAIIDATKPAPRLLFWRDISHLGTKAVLDAIAEGAPQ